MNYDTIIIGAGLGGLTAGAKLTKEGKKVLLIEQHTIPGGCATTFKRKDYTMEVGLHEMDGLHKNDMKTKIFRDLGVFDKVEFLKVPEFYRFVNERYDIVIPHDPDEAIKILINNFPDEEKGIKAYFHQVMNARQIIKESAGEKERTVGEFLDSIIENNDLKLVLLGNLGYFHDDPYSLSLSYYSVAQGSYYTGGGNFIKGGSQELSNHLAAFIEDNGGKVILKHLVTDIITDDNKAIGVVYRKKKKRSKKAFADNIIANAAIPNVANLLLPWKHGEKLRQQFKNMEPGASLLTVYFGFKKPLKKIGNKYYSTFIYDSSVKTQADIFENNKSDFTKRSFTFVDYSQVDSGLAPEGKSVGTVCCVDYTSNWENLEKIEYIKRKNEVAQIFIDRLEELIPGFTEAIEYYEVATSKTVEQFTLNPEGAVYGFAQTPIRATSEKIKTIENLYFASAWAKLGGGFSGAIYNGYLCAFEILRKRE